MGLDGSTGLDLKTGFHGQGLVFIELVKLVILDSGFKGFGSTTFWTVGFGPALSGIRILDWFGFGFLVFAGIGYQSTSDTNVYGMNSLYNCTNARFPDYGIYCPTRNLS